MSPRAFGLMVASRRYQVVGPEVGLAGITIGSLKIDVAPSYETDRHPRRLIAAHRASLPESPWYQSTARLVTMLDAALTR